MSDEVGTTPRIELLKLLDLADRYLRDEIQHEEKPYNLEQLKKARILIQRAINIALEVVRG